MDMSLSLRLLIHWTITIFARAAGKSPPKTKERLRYSSYSPSASAFLIVPSYTFSQSLPQKFPSLKEYPELATMKISLWNNEISEFWLLDILGRYIKIAICSFWTANAFEMSLRKWWNSSNIRAFFFFCTISGVLFSSIKNLNISWKNVEMILKRRAKDSMHLTIFKKYVM